MPIMNNPTPTRRQLLICIIFVSIYILNWDEEKLLQGVRGDSSGVHANDGVLFRQNFENEANDWDFDDYNNLINYQSYISQGMEYGRMIKVSYPPHEWGSPRVQKKFDLGDGNEQIKEATLSFDFKLHSKFEFVRGGKMHGLGGGTATMGCDPIDPDGWSTRMMWRANGLPELYVYHQDRKYRCGDFYNPSNFFFAPDSWYRIDIQIKMNSSPASKDGRALLYIDGVKQVEVNGLHLSGNANVNIDKFLFSTFYGGHDPSWSPSKTTYVYYDNFTVHRGLKVTGKHGTTCEIFLMGVYHPVRAVCCDNSCGSCGGIGCAGLNGGESSCCVSAIEAANNSCESASYGPCVF